MYKSTTKLAVVAVGLLTFNCLFVAAQLYGTNGYGVGVGGVDTAGRYYGNAAGQGQYHLNGYDPNTARRLEYGGGAGFPGAGGYERDYYGYGRQYGRNYYGYYNGAVSSQSTGCVFWLTFALTTALAFKVFV